MYAAWECARMLAVIVACHTCKLLMRAAHSPGDCCSQVQKWALTQERSLYASLEAGVRYFDIRVYAKGTTIT